MEEVDRYPFPPLQHSGSFRYGLDSVSNPKHPSDHNFVRVGPSINDRQHSVREEKEDGRPCAPCRNCPLGNYLRGGRSTPKGRRLSQQSLPRK